MVNSNLCSLTNAVGGGVHDISGCARRFRDRISLFLRLVSVGSNDVPGKVVLEDQAARREQAIRANQQVILEATSLLHMPSA